VEDIASRFGGQQGIRNFKESCSEVVSESLRSFRDEYERIRKEDGYLKEREVEGARRAREVAQGVMREVKALVGTD
jgi:tryptophanyl-tRNA synthetase